MRETPEEKIDDLARIVIDLVTVTSCLIATAPQVVQEAMASGLSGPSTKRILSMSLSMSLEFENEMKKKGKSDKPS